MRDEEIEEDRGRQLCIVLESEVGEDVVWVKKISDERVQQTTSTGIPSSLVSQEHVWVVGNCPVKGTKCF